MFELIPGFANFLIWEQQSKDTIDFKKVYVDMAGDLLSGLLLSQLVFWYLPNKDGGNKLRVHRDGEFWIAKSRDEWWEEVRMAPREVDKCLETLRAQGIIETHVWKFAGNPTTHIRILPQGFMDCLNAVTKEGKQRPKAKFQRDGQRGRKSPEALSQMCDNGPFPKSKKTESHICDNLEVLDLEYPYPTSNTSSTETSPKTTIKNFQRVLPSASQEQKEPDKPKAKGREWWVQQDTPAARVYCQSKGWERAAEIRPEAAKGEENAVQS